MSNQEYEDGLKRSIRIYENLAIDYSKMLEGLFKDKIVFSPEQEVTVWYKAYLREEKNSVDKYLKELREELTNYRQGLNPPYCYIHK
jgi:hypothetical protein